MPSCSAVLRPAGRCSPSASVVSGIADYAAAPSNGARDKRTIKLTGNPIRKEKPSLQHNRGAKRTSASDCRPRPVVCSLVRPRRPAGSVFVRSHQDYGRDTAREPCVTNERPRFGRCDGHHEMVHFGLRIKCHSGQPRSLEFRKSRTNCCRWRAEGCVIRRHTRTPSESGRGLGNLTDE